MVAVLDRMEAPAAASNALVIDYMYLDLETCTRCRGTDANLEAALAQVEQVHGPAAHAVRPAAGRVVTRGEPRVAL